MLFLTKKQKTKNKRIFAFLNKRNKKTIRESLLFLTKKQKTKNTRIFVFLNKKNKKNNKIIFAFLNKKNKKLKIREPLLFLTKQKQKIEEGWIHCVFIIEMLGKPKEHLEKTTEAAGEEK